MNPEIFQDSVLAWFDRHGRKDLPWHRDPSAYRVWVSEIMLQQTQVITVIPYFERFMRRFPDVTTLAEADLDNVLHHWSGLGYYARARNLHQAAQVVRDEHGSEFPGRFDDLITLPGIGRSTAGAILALSAGRRHAILDGNVKRVLARHFAVEGWPGRSAVLTRLWEWAERLTPSRRVGDYTQAMMDLGATVCTRTRPGCARCPLAASCAAHVRGEETAFPGRRPKRDQPLRRTRLLMLRDASGAVLLERRPPVGLWGGLWCLPECPTEVDPEAWCRERLGCEAGIVTVWAERRHTFSHFRLDYEPVEMRVDNPSLGVMEGAARVWYNAAHPDRLGLAAPVERLLNELLHPEPGESDEPDRELCEVG